MSLMPLLLLSISLAAPGPANANDSVAVVVVRHAEKDDDDKHDPSLAGDGEVRAQALSTTLAGAGLDRAITTQYRRTRQTAEPAAAAAGIAVEVREINAGNAASYAADLASDLRAMPAGSTVLVVGHSNTVPDIVLALSGQAAEAMPETEYDRYTLVLLDADGGARVITTRY
ncbi:phosphoglycerate mutase [Arenimonas soli]|uniref:Phosphoglycerate mutase n=1 Tax=Arenimonas soli TaxID=2269504 RepID=A0ABQ1HD61_9GAMM|nr:phosphoglycerate mutase family protein [Arenimonas soli]GGA71920.1 phosphoglycerate mutase [Arenimonas soli]